MADAVLCAFKVFDPDATGKVSAGTLRFVLQKLGTGMTDDEVKEVLLEADAVGDGSVDYSAFVHDVLFPG